MSPLYEYRCPACGNHEEKLQTSDAPTLHPCPECGADAERIPSIGSFRMEASR